MLGVISNKQKDGSKYIYSAKWVSKDKTKCSIFRFAMAKDDDIRKVDFNKLSGNTGEMKIETKSTIPFMPEDVIIFRCQRYTIQSVDGDRKRDGEQAMAHFVSNGNIVVYLTLRRAG